MRIQPSDVRVAIAGEFGRSSTTIAAAGASVVVVAGTLPDRAVALTYCHLGRRDGAIAASHLHLGSDGQERLAAHVLPHAPHVERHARVCLLDHAAELQQERAALTGPRVTVDVGLAAPVRAVDAWGPPAPDG